jgi:hypothetical protein
VSPSALLGTPRSDLLSDEDDSLHSVGSGFGEETAAVSFPVTELEPNQEEEEEYLSPSVPQVPSVPETVSSPSADRAADELSRPDNDKDGDMSTNSFSSSREPPVPKGAVSFENIEETAFFASRGGGESEFSGPPPKPIEADAAESQSSDFEGLPRKAAPPAPPEATLFDCHEDMTLDQSRDESLFTASDFPLFEDPPVLYLSTSSEFEEKQKKKVVIFDPKVIQTHMKVSEPVVTVRQRLSASVTEISGAFAHWKSRTLEKKGGRKPALSFRVDPDALRADIPKNRNSGPTLRDLSDKHRLISQIDRQRDINRHLGVRLEQIQSERATAQAIARPARSAPLSSRLIRFTV